jgi:rhodanese-related sulfurtransferase
MRKYYLLQSCLFFSLFLAVPGRAQTQDLNGDTTHEGETQKATEILTSAFRTIFAVHRAAILDIRPFKDYAIGHIPGALNIALQPGESRSLYISDKDAVERLVSQNNDTPIVLCCDERSDAEGERLADELLADGYTNVMRYPLGLSISQAIDGPAQVELVGVAYILANDRNAIFIDAREPSEFRTKTLPGARNLPYSKVVAQKGTGDVIEASDEWPLSREDQNVRVIVFGDNEEQALAVAGALTRHALADVAFFAGPVQELFMVARAERGK